MKVEDGEDKTLIFALALFWLFSSKNVHKVDEAVQNAKIAY